MRRTSRYLMLASIVATLFVGQANQASQAAQPSAVALAAARRNFVPLAARKYATTFNRWRFLLRKSNTPGPPQINYLFGNPSLGDLPLVGDFDGNGVSSLGVARPDKNHHILWLLRNRLNSGTPGYQFVYGNADTDIPLMGDWNGDGSTTPGIVRLDTMGNFTWLLRNTNSTGPPDVTFSWGSTAGFAAVTGGDWDGLDGDSQGWGVGTINVNTDTGHWIWDLKNALVEGTQDVPEFEYGGIANNDVPIPADWDGNKSQTAGITREDPTTHYWHWLLRNSNTAGPPDVTPFIYGTAKTPDIPVAGNWVGGTGTPQTVGVARPVHVST